MPLSRVSILKNAGICPMEQVCVLHMLPSGMCYSAVGHEFSVNEINIYINKVSLNINTHEMGLGIDWL